MSDEFTYNPADDDNMGDIDIEIPVEVERFSYYTGDSVVYYRVKDLFNGGWDDWRVVRR